MIARARLGAGTAAVLASEGGSRPAVQLLDGLEEELRTDYWDLYNRVAALARTEPASPTWRRLTSTVGGVVPLLSSGSQAEAVSLIRSLAGEMERTVGEALPERDADVAITIVSREIRE